MTEATQYTETEQMLALRRYAGASPRLLDALLHRFGTLPEIFKANRARLLEIDGITEETVTRLITASEQLPDARAYIKSLLDRDIGVVSRFESTYPRLLFELNDPPMVLFYRGHLPDSNKKTVGLMGAGQASIEGMELTSALAREFVQQGVQVISSLSGGIDAAAHLAVSTAEGHPFAVTDYGFDSVPDGAAMPVAIDLVRQGGVISEYAPDETDPPNATGEVNRLIVGLSQAVVVTEMYEDSARILDLVRFCSDIGKLLFFMVNPEHGALSDESSLATALGAGAVPIRGLDHVSDIIDSLV